MLLLMGLVGCGSKVSDVNPSSPVVSTSHTELQSQVDSQSTGKTSAPTEEAKPWDTPTHLVLFMVGNINESRTRDGHLGVIVWALAMAGQTEQALEVAQQIELAQLKVDALSAVAAGLAAAGELSRAMELTEQIETATGRVGALIDIASAQINAGEQEQALTALSQALELAQQPEVASNRFGHLTRVYSTLIRAGDYTRAREVGQQIFQDSSTSVLIEIASAQVDAGDKKRALETLSQALEMAQNSNNLFAQFDLGLIPGAFAKAGDYARAMEVAQQLSSDVDKASVLVGIASHQVAAGDKEQGLATLSQAEELVQQIGTDGAPATPDLDSALTKALRLREIASVQVDAGEQDRAAGTLSQALELAQQVENAIAKANTLNDIASAYVRAGKTSQALEIAQQIEHAATKQYLLREIAMALSTSGGFEQALDVAQQIEPGTIKAITLSGIALAEVDAEKTTQVLDSAQQNKDLLLMHMAMGLATEPVPEKKRDNMRPAASRRMKKAFTTKEKELARQLVDAI
jgi:tetratricopeptide (TPR) repeat protein